MWKTFKAELTFIFKHKWRIWEWLIIAIIPFLYGFFYMNAYWNPFGKTDSLRIAVVNLDKSQSSEEYINKIIQDGKNGIETSNNIYKANIEVADDTYSTEEQAQNLVENNQKDAVIIIHKGFDETLTSIKNAVKNIIIQAGLRLAAGLDINFMDLASKIEEAKHNTNQLVTFYNSVKYNYLAGEITNLGSDISQLSTSVFIPPINEILRNIPILNVDQTQILEEVIDFIKIKGNVINSTKSYGSNINTYGFGMSPYFICIALWAGALVMTFLFKNKRHIHDQRTWKHYFGKSLAWIFTGWLQSIILISAVTLQGVNIGINQWQIFLLGIFISTVFCLTIQGIAYSFRYGDIGEFVIVILLILQLTSSSGTFPVEMQNSIFEFIHPLIPFTYAINSIRETFDDTQPKIIIENLMILLIFPAITTTMGLSINYAFDKLHINRHNKYKSFEIHLGDF